MNHRLLCVWCEHTPLVLISVQGCGGGHTVQRSEGGRGGALVFPPFIASKVSVSCSRLCGERERERERDERTGEESQHVSILTHQREQRKQQQNRRRDLKSRRGRKGSTLRPHLHFSEREDNSIPTRHSSLVPPLLI